MSLASGRGELQYFQTGVSCRNREITLLDTPGHEDFGAEMEQFIIPCWLCGAYYPAGADGCRGHDRNLWRLLEHYSIPAFIFVNKWISRASGRTS